MDENHRIQLKEIHHDKKDTTTIEAASAVLFQAVVAGVIIALGSAACFGIGAVLLDFQLIAEYGITPLFKWIIGLSLISGIGLTTFLSTFNFAADEIKLIQLSYNLGFSKRNEEVEFLQAKILDLEQNGPADEMAKKNTRKELLNKTSTLLGMIYNSKVDSTRDTLISKGVVTRAQYDSASSILKSAGAVKGKNTPSCGTLPQAKAKVKKYLSLQKAN